MERGTSYFGVRDPRHAERDLDEMFELRVDAAVFLQELDLRLVAVDGVLLHALVVGDIDEHRRLELRGGLAEVVDVRRVVRWILGLDQGERRHVVGVGDEPGRGSVVRMHVLAVVGQNHVGFVLADQVHDGEAVVERVGDAAVEEVEETDFGTQFLGGGRGLALSDGGDLLLSRVEAAVLASGEVDDGDIVAAVGVLGEGSTAEDVGVVGMCDDS